MAEFSDISGIVMAAGHSSRMEGGNKLLLPWGERCVIEAVVESVCGVGLREVIVVVGHQRELVEKKVAKYPVRAVYNADYAEGMASSIRVGVEAAKGKGYLFVLGDMPKVKGETMGTVAGMLGYEKAIAVPVIAQRWGNPVGIGGAYREELLGLEGDRGARSVVRKNLAHVIEVEVRDLGIFVDVDTEEAYRAALAGLMPGQSRS